MISVCLFPTEYTYIIYIYIRVKHSARFTTFTVQSFTLITVYFVAVTICSFIGLYPGLCETYGIWGQTQSSQTTGYTAPPADPSLASTLSSFYFIITQNLLNALVRLVWVLYEISLPVSCLITTVVTFVLCPAAYMAGVSSGLTHPLALIMHNFNVIFMISELYFSCLHLDLNHFALPVVWGLVYTCFSWFWFHQTGIFYYFFIDYTSSPGHSIPGLIGLLCMLLMFHTWCVGQEDRLNHHLVDLEHLTGNDN